MFSRIPAAMDAHFIRPQCSDFSCDVRSI